MNYTDLHEHFKSCCRFLALCTSVPVSHLPPAGYFRIMKTQLYNSVDNITSNQVVVISRSNSSSSSSSSSGGGLFKFTEKHDRDHVVN